jgi:putative membrane protein
MKILISIILNSSILYAITYLLWANITKDVEAWVILWCLDCSYESLEALKTYLIWWIILWWINITVKPILKILSLPLFFIFFGLVIFIVNAIVLKLFTYIINDILIIPWIAYNINWWINFIIAVAIFSILNMVYSLLSFKK